MIERNQVRDAERLSEDAARRLLDRASELEAARGSEVSVAELRDAAREAGITLGAFEQALAEYRGAGSSSSGVAGPVRRGRFARLWPAAVVVAGSLSVLVLRMLFAGV
jgi:hypothetical protein